MDEKVSRIQQLINQKKVIVYDADIEDKENPSVRWSIYGLPDTNEIAVVLQYGELMYAEVRPSEVLMPPMRDRVFGIDVLDSQLAIQMSNALWELHKDKLGG